MRPLIYWLAICGIAFSIYAVLTVLAKAEQEDKTDQQLTLATQTPLYAQTDVPRCWGAKTSRCQCCGSCAGRMG